MRAEAYFLLLLLLMTVVTLDVDLVIGKTEAPDFDVMDISGEPFTLSTHRGKVVVIDAFGTRCAPCISEIEHLIRLYHRYPHDQVVIVSIDVAPVEPNDDYLRAFAQQHGMEWIVARDTDQVGDRYGVSAIPTLFLVDPDGYYATPYVGLTPASELVEEIDSFYITIVSPQNKQYTTAVVPLDFAISKPAAWIGYSLDGDTNVTIPGNTSLTDLAEGQHDVVVYFRDAGSLTVYSNQVHFTIDTATQQTGGPPYTLIAIIVGASIIALLVGLVIAGQLLGWSESPKKRRKRSH